MKAWSAPNRSSPACRASAALNCACPPGRLRNTTRWRATARAIGTAEILLHQRQRQVDARGDPRGGPDRAVAHEDRVRLDPGQRVAPGQRGALRPVGHGPPPVEEPGRAQQKGPGADRGDPARARGPRPHPGHQGRIVAGRQDAGAARDHQGVQRRVEIRQRIGHQPQARRGGEPEVAGRDHPRRVGRAYRAALVGGGEDLERPGHVEELHRREGQHLHGTRALWRETRDLWHVRQRMAL